MTKKEILVEIKNQKNIMNTLHKEGKLDEALKVMDKIENLEKDLKIAEKNEQLEGTGVKDFVKVNPEPKKESFYNVFKNPAKFANAMSGAGAEGLLLPETDVKTVKDLRREFGSLEDLITIIPTNTRKGSYIIENLNDSEGLTEVEELADITEVTNLSFSQVKWNIKDYAGLLKISKTLLNDTVENLQNRITNALARKGAITIRKKILEVLNSFEEVSVDDIDGIKEVINVKLDMALLEGSVIVMGQETFHYIDTLKDSTGNYLFQNDITSPSGKVLFGLPVKVVNKKVLAKGIVYVGNTKEAVHEYVMEGIQIAQSEHAYFNQNAVAFRGIERFDIAKADTEAVFKVTINSLTTLVNSRKGK